MIGAISQTQAAGTGEPSAKLAAHIIGWNTTCAAIEMPSRAVISRSASAGAIMTIRRETHSVRPKPSTAGAKAAAASTSP